VYELPGGGGEKILHEFDKTDGFYPDTGLIQDPDGNLYGGTYGMGAMLYRMSPGGTFATLFQFNQSDANGTFPMGNLLRDGQGNLFVNNYYGGNCGCGTVFELAASGTGSARHQFGAWPQDGSYPVGNLLHMHNRIYGVTGNGGEYGEGTAWALNL
jgi:hypothetical protein